jgi:RimJ/RimL family protein N-acetyltransferase
MIKGKKSLLRPLTEADLPEFQRHMADYAPRGDYYPHFIVSEAEIRQNYARDGYWTEDHGLLLIVNDGGKMIGDIEFFKPVEYWNAYEIAYLLFDPAERGKGIVTEATQLLTRYLFENRLVNRIQLCIHPENLASRRIAEKCGYTLEGTARGAWFQRGQHVDMQVFSILRSELPDR